MSLLTGLDFFCFLTYVTLAVSAIVTAVRGD
jgi:hypothetical protein